MNAVAFDTLRFVRALRDKAKLSPEQAEGFADAIAEAIQNDLATKGDIEELKRATSAEIKDLKATTTAEIKDLKATTTAEIKDLKGEFNEFKHAVSAEIKDLKGEFSEFKHAMSADFQELKRTISVDTRDIRSDQRATELRLEAKIEATKAEIVKWMFGTIGFQTLIILGAVIALARIVRP